MAFSRVDRVCAVTVGRTFCRDYDQGHERRINGSAGAGLSTMEKLCFGQASHSELLISVCKERGNGRLRCRVVFRENVCSQGFRNLHIGLSAACCSVARIGLAQSEVLAC